MIWVFLLLAALVVAIPAITIYLPYLRSQERRWRGAVQSAYRAAQRQISAEATELQKLGQRQRAEERALAEKAFQAFIASISARELGAYPGIGPATVARLEQNGYTDLAKLTNTTIRAHGLGEKRLTDVVIAVRHLMREAESRFKAGACRQAHELADDKARVAARHKDLGMRAKARQAAAAEVVRQLEKPAALARQVTFWKYFWRGPDVVVPPGVLESPLPDLQKALTIAGKQAPTDPAAPLSRGKPGPGTSFSNAVAVSETVAAPDAGAPVTPSALKGPGSVPARQPKRTGDEQAIASLPASHPPSSPPPVSFSTQPAAGDGHDSLEATIEFVYAIARTDGSLARKEKELIEEVMERLHGSDQAIYNRVKGYCAYYETASIDVGSSIKRIKERAVPAQRRQLFLLARRIVEASGTMNQREITFLERVAQEWDVAWVGPGPDTTSAPLQAASVKGVTAVKPEPAPTTENDSRSVLGIDSSATLTAELVRQRFQLYSARLAPEKVETMGAEFVAMANRKLNAIRVAAEELIQPFGESLESQPERAEPAELRHNPDLDEMFGA
jgi:uncharacterized tellurite resistance protein B-like protein/Arc/MetJ family transcription regulator